MDTEVLYKENPMLADEALWLGEPCAHVVAYYDRKRALRNIAEMRKYADRRQARRVYITH